MKKYIMELTNMKGGCTINRERELHQLKVIW